MRLSDDKINELSHLITKQLESDSRIAFEVSANLVRLSVRKAIGKAMHKESEITLKAEERITSQKKVIHEGTNEWEALFWQYYEDELGKLRTIK